MKIPLCPICRRPIFPSTFTVDVYKANPPDGVAEYEVAHHTCPRDFGTDIIVDTDELPEGLNQEDIGRRCQIGHFTMYEWIGHVWVHYRLDNVD